MTPRRQTWSLAVVIVVGVSLYLPALGTGFYADDHTHQLVLSGSMPMPKPPVWNLYDFGTTADWAVPGGEADALPWWTSPDWKIRFFRPVTSATLVLDHAMFGGWAPGYHATSLLWYAALLLLVHALYRALGLAPGAAVISLALFAATNGAALPAGWPSNRNTLIAAVFVVAALLVAVRSGGMSAARTPWWRLSLALPLAGLACLAKESGVIGLVLLALWFLGEARRACDPAAQRSTRAAAAACGALALAYLGALAMAGYGTRSLFYATPWSDPLRYASNLLTLFTAGLLRLVFPVSLDLRMVIPAIVVPAGIAGALVAGLLVYRGSRMIRDGGAAAFLGVWIVVSLAVEGGAVPSDRLLLSAAIGSAGLLGMFIAGALVRDAGAGRPAPRSHRIVAGVLLATAGVLSAGFTVLQSTAIGTLAGQVRAAALQADLGVPRSGPREILVLQAESPFLPFTMAGTLAVERPDLERRIHTLQFGRRALDWTREDRTTFLLRSRDEPFLTHVTEGVFLSRPAAAAVGDTWRTAAFDAQAVEVDAAGLRAVRFRMHRSLDDAGVRFLLQRQGRLVAVAPPRIGETLAMPRAIPANPLMP